jgi:hypothetical protein
MHPKTLDAHLAEKNDPKPIFLKNNSPSSITQAIQDYFFRLTVVRTGLQGGASEPTVSIDMPLLRIMTY